MADTVRLVEYFYITAPNKPGEGARALNTLKEAGVKWKVVGGFLAPGDDRVGAVAELLERLGAPKIKGTIVLLFESSQAMASCEALIPFSVTQRLQRLNQALIALAVFTGQARQVRALSGGR